MPSEHPLPSAEKVEIEEVQEELEDEETPEYVRKIEAPYGTVEWLYWWSDKEGHLGVPINISITGSHFYQCPELEWYNFEVYPHKVKLTNTGYTVHVGAKWKTERPYLLGGPLLEKHVIGQMHFHWGPNMMVGSAHTVDSCPHPAELQVTFFKAEYMTQKEALKHHDGVVMICYLIKYGVKPDPRLDWIIEGFPRVKEVGAWTKVGPKPMLDLLPMFSEDYFMYWGSLKTAAGSSHVIRWIVSRKPLWATAEQIQSFRTIWDVWDEPNKGNLRPLEERKNRHVFFINRHWNLYNTLLPIPRIKEPSISILSDEYKRKPWMLPPLNSSLIALFTGNESTEKPDDKEPFSLSAKK
ncbi:eukaryotic-type carbonic anhydrase domain-containing protein [Phthorimaea operculella]|nr:eukaryotic-type carbonic anhydrase domain-containing protein [Phthorimaea operculella]